MFGPYLQLRGKKEQETDISCVVDFSKCILSIARIHTRYCSVVLKFCRSKNTSLDFQ
jgi:hypothetical protein